MKVLLLVLLLASHAFGWSNTKGYSDTAAGSGTGAPGRIYIPAAGCVVATPASNWDIYSVTDPTPTCITGTVIKKGVLTFNEAGTTCTSTTATTGCAFATIQLPSDFQSAGQIDAKILFTSTDVTNAHTIIWKLSTKCTTPVSPGAGTIDDPATLNAADTLTYTCGASEVSASLRSVTKTSIAMTGCTGGDLLHIRIGRDIADTATTNVNFVGLELTLFQSQ